jgi:hypothetical protein
MSRRSTTRESGTREIVVEPRHFVADARQPRDRPRRTPTWCPYCLASCRAGLSTRHNRGARPAAPDAMRRRLTGYWPFARGPWGAQGCAICPALGLAATAPERAQGEAAAAGARAAAQAGRSISVRSTAIRSPRSEPWCSDCGARCARNRRRCPISSACMPWRRKRGCLQNCDCDSEDREGDCMTRTVIQLRVLQ